MVAYLIAKQSRVLFWERNFHVHNYNFKWFNHRVRIHGEGPYALLTGSYIVIAILKFPNSGIPEFPIFCTYRNSGIFAI